MKVGIQGVKGSYHHLVAQNYFESIELVECMTFAGPRSALPEAELRES